MWRAPTSHWSSRLPVLQIGVFFPLIGCPFPSSSRKNVHGPLTSLKVEDTRNNLIKSSCAFNTSFILLHFRTFCPRSLIRELQRWNISFILWFSFHFSPAFSFILFHSVDCQEDNIVTVRHGRLIKAKPHTSETHSRHVRVHRRRVTMPPYWSAVSYKQSLLSTPRGVPS